MADKEFTMGADPEFACEYRGNIVEAGDILGNWDTAELGADGNGTTFELRPKPAKDPLQVVTNIRDIFVRNTIKYPDLLKYNWVAATFYKGYPLGGHVHFGTAECGRFDTRQAIHRLDNYVGAVTLLMEDKDDGIERRGDGYGCMGDMRAQNWGFEYRPMSCWLGSPYVASAVLCLAKTVMHEYLNNPKFPWRDYVTNDDFREMRQDRIAEHFPKVWNDITKMALYPQYQQYIDLIQFLVNNKLTWFPNTGMKESWAIVNMQKIITNKVGMKSIWDRYNQSVAA